ARSHARLASVTSHDVSEKRNTGNSARYRGWSVTMATQSPGSWAFASKIASGERDRVGFLRGALEQHALAGRLHQHPLGIPLVPVPPGVLAPLVHVGR